VFSSSSSYDPDGYIAERKWYINGVYQSASTTLSKCFVLFGTTGTSCYQLGSGATSVSIKLEVKDNAGEWRSSTVSYTIRAEKARRYFVTDHLGSVRTTVDWDGNVLGHDDYYPFGLSMPGRSVNTANPDDNYKFTGYEKEDEGGLNLYHANARSYDPILGRFNQIDKFHDKYPFSSPYSYTLNSPTNFTDVTGDTVDVSNLSSDEQKQLINSLAEVTGYSKEQFKIENGILTVSKSEKTKDGVELKYASPVGGSSTARKDLGEAINSTNVINVISHPTLTGVPNTEGGSNDILIQFRDANERAKNVSAGLNPETLGIGLTFFHELQHTAAFGTKKDPLVAATGITGEVVDHVNTIRRELDANSVFGPLYLQRIQYGVVR